MQVWNVLHAARWNTGRKKSPKICHLGAIAQTCRAITFASKARIDNRKKTFKQQYLLQMSPQYMMNFGLLPAEICWRVWGTPANFNGFRVVAALLHGTILVGVSQTLPRWTEGATYIRQGGHHDEHWPTFLVHLLISARLLVYIVCFPSYEAYSFLTLFPTYLLP